MAVACKPANTMATLIEDIKVQSNWIIKAFKADGLTLDHSINSFIELDKFFQLHAENGQAIKGRRLSKNLGSIIFSIASYIGETLTKTVPGSVWETDDSDPQGEMNIAVKLPDGTTCWPAHRVIKRFQNGLEDGIYPYGFELTKSIINDDFDDSFWKIEKEVKPLEPKKPFWKFW